MLSCTIKSKTNTYAVNRGREKQQLLSCQGCLGCCKRQLSVIGDGRRASAQTGASLCRELRGLKVRWSGNFIKALAPPLTSCPSQTCWIFKYVCAWMNLLVRYLLCERGQKEVPFSSIKWEYLCKQKEVWGGTQWAWTACQILISWTSKLSAAHISLTIRQPRNCTGNFTNRMWWKPFSRTHTHMQIR